jgi:hypothetical protein
MFDFSQTLLRIGRFLNAPMRRDRKIGRSSAPNCCSAESYDRAQRSAFLARRIRSKSPSLAAAEPSATSFALARSASALLGALVRVGGTLKISPEKSNTIVTVSLPWEANDASTSATGS